MPSGVTASRLIGLSADASPPGCGDARAAFRAALAAAPWQRSPGSRFVRLRSRRPRTVNGCIRWLPEVAIIPPWSPAGASRPGSPCVRGMLPRVASPCARLSRGSPRRSLVGRGRHAVAGRCKMCIRAYTASCSRRARTDILPCGAVPRACGTPVAFRSRETRRGALAPLQDVPIKLVARSPNRYRCPRRAPRGRPCDRKRGARGIPRHLHRRGRERRRNPFLHHLDTRENPEHCR